MLQEGEVRRWQQQEEEARGKVNCCSPLEEAHHCRSLQVPFLFLQQPVRTNIGERVSKLDMEIESGEGN
jgi:hypothetical protein